MELDWNMSHFSFLFATGGAAVTVQSRPADSGITGSGWPSWSKQQKMADPIELVPRGPVMRRAHPRRSISTVDESFYIESLLAPEHVVDGASQFVSQCGQGFRLAVFLFQPSQVRLTLRIVSKEPHSGFREGPLQINGCELTMAFFPTTNRSVFS
jgi:hypothetical protein